AKDPRALSALRRRVRNRRALRLARDDGAQSGGSRESTGRRAGVAVPAGDSAARNVLVLARERRCGPGLSVAAHDAARTAAQVTTTIGQRDHHSPVLGIEAQGSRGGSAPPFCSSSTEIRSGERTNAMCPSRGGRLIVMPCSVSRWHIA